jgi:hypothetical protein
MRLECIVVVRAMFASNGAQRCERSAMSWGYTTTPNWSYYLPCDDDSLVATCRRQVSMTMCRKEPQPCLFSRTGFMVV